MPSRRAILAAFGLLIVPDVQARRKKTIRKKKRRALRRRKHDVFALLRLIALSQTHGDRDDHLDGATLLAMIESGQRVYCRCGTIVNAAIEACRRARVPARRVGALTREPWNGVNDGHVMIEVAGTLWDIDNNRRAPYGVGIVQQIGRMEWVSIADDPVCLTECEIINQLAAFDARIFQVPWIEDHGVYRFHDSDRRFEAHGFVYTKKQRWQQLVAQGRSSAWA